MRQRPAELWTPRQLRQFVVLSGVVVLVLVIAALGARGSDELGHQVGWLNFGVVAVLLGAGVDAMWCFLGRSAVTARVHRLLDQGPRRPSGSLPGSGPLVVLASGASARAHRESCVLVVGKHVRRVGTDEIVRDGLGTCESCHGA